MIGKKRLWDLVVVLTLLALPFLLLWPVTIGGKSLVPFDNLYAFQPWQAFAEQVAVEAPHNELLSDLLLENYVWKSFIREAIADLQAPLWNPYIFAGVPFLAAGQHSALYPLSVVFYVMPVHQAYGYFTAVHLFLAALFMHIFLRTLRVGRVAATVAGLIYAFSGFMIVSIDFPMIIAAATWLPLVLAMMELAIRRVERRGTRPPPLLYLLGAALALGIQFLAGHAEMSYYVVMVVGLYGAYRLGIMWWRSRETRDAAFLALLLGGMVALGAGLGGVQLVPFLELARVNFRESSATLQEILGWAFPLRQVITFFIPDFFGNPSHHGYFDLISRQWTTISQNARGEAVSSIFWGIKNYVEAGSYVGLLGFLFAIVAVLRRRGAHVWFFTGLAVGSFLLSFGMPLYGLLYHLLPGYSQLHTPFRWVFPYTVSMATLAGLGTDTLRDSVHRSSRFDLGVLGVRLLGWLALGAGALGLVAGLLILAAPGPFIPLAEQLLARSDLAQASFPNGRAFLSYEWRNLLLFSLFLFASGGVVTLGQLWRRPGGPLRSGRIWGFLAVSVLVLDLFSIAVGFNPAADPGLIAFTPPAIEFLQQQDGLFRITTFDAPGEKTLNANMGMYYGLHDIRGYDSLIPRQYVMFMELIESQGELVYNRIAPLYRYDSLDSPLLDLLNVKYVMTTQHIPNARYTPVYDEEVRIYRNEDYLPRAFVVCQAEVYEDEAELLSRLTEIDPSERVLLTEQPPAELLSGEPGSCAHVPSEVSFREYGLNQVTVEVQAPEGGWLVLADSYFPGWKAYLQEEDQERELSIYRADFNFRAVHLNPGHSAVRFRYSPMSLKLGIYASFIAGVVMLAAGGYWLWGRLYREDEGDPVIKRVAKNSMTPMATSFLNKLIDTAFAMLMLRILGPEGAGKYGFAVVVYAFLEILTNFGLTTLLTREVSKDRGQTNRYLSNSAILRLILLMAMSPLLLIFLFAWRTFFDLANDTTVAILLLAVSLVPGSISAAVTSVFLAYEKMEYPAAITVVTTVIRVSLGVVVLLMGLGIIGLAGVAVVTNVVTMLILTYFLVRLIMRPQLEFDAGFNRSMVGTSYPLMINHLLATLFWRVDVTLLQPMKGNAVVGWYTTAYRFLDALVIIPSTFTVAIFPLMSRYAKEARHSLVRTYTTSLKVLIIISLPIALLTTFYADGIILIVGGSAYLPHAAIALRLLVWSIPFGFVNSVTQYVLIAIDKQRFLTVAFMIGAGFNLVANLALIPAFSYQAAAVTTILSEVVLLIPFYYGVRKHLSSIPWVELAWRPVISVLIAGGVTWLLRDVSFLIVIPLSLGVYGACLLATGTIGADDISLIRQLLPGRSRSDTAGQLPEA